jgi:hypothetical protein
MNSFRNLLTLDQERKLRALDSWHRALENCSLRMDCPDAYHEELLRQADEMDRQGNRQLGGMARFTNGRGSGPFACSRRRGLPLICSWYIPGEISAGTGDSRSGFLTGDSNEQNAEVRY